MTATLEATSGEVRLPCAAVPRVSVIILAWRHHELLRQCLTSLVAAAGDGVPFEVIIVVNGASPAVVQLVEQDVKGAVVVPSRVNLGFAGGCNRARAVARGEFLLLLNDDTVVERGWMRALVETLDVHPEAGAVGSRVLFVDGTVQEAGCVIWNDGSTAPVGRGSPDTDQRLDHLRRVDYCSACSLMVRTATWDRVGGLDERYYPGYYEDTDLCLAIQRAGQAVLYQPASRVRHHESRSLDSHYKSFVFSRCKSLFIDKWRPELPRFLPPGVPDALDRAVERARGNRRVLIVDDRLPAVGTGSGFQRMHETVLELSAGGWSVTAFASDRPGTDPAALGAVGVAVVPEDLGAHLRRPTSAYDAVILSRPNNFERFASLVRDCQPGAAIVYDAEALYHRRLARQIDLAERPDTSARLRAEHDRLLGIEAAIGREADAVVAISEDEAAFFRANAPGTPVRVRPPLTWEVEPDPAGFADRADILMVAGWLAGADSPNADGLRWFVRAVSPIVRTHLPWVRLLVTGADPPDAVKGLAGPNVTFLGHVADLAGAYGRARVVIAPIRFGAGVKVKTAEALEHGVPVVATTVGAEGLGSPIGSAISVADDPRGFAEHLIRLLSSRREWEAQRGRILDARAAARGSRRPAWGDILTEAGRQAGRARAAGPA